jgi:hypothetical protein
MLKTGRTGCTQTSVDHYQSMSRKGGYTLVTLPRIVSPYRDSVDGTRDRVTYQICLRGNVTGFFGVLSVFGRRIKGMIRLRPEQVWTCNVALHVHTWRGEDWSEMAWSGLGCSGVDWGLVEWIRVAWSGVDRSQLAWSGVYWSGLGFNGVDWSGLAWRGVDWSGLDWSGVQWIGA